MSLQQLQTYSKTETAYMSKNTIFKQLLSLIPRKEFSSISRDLGNEKYTKKFTGWNHLVTLLFAQIKGFSSIREFESGLTSHNRRWYHLGIKPIKRSTIEKINL